MRAAGIPEVKDKETFKAYRLRIDVSDVQAAGDERAQLAYGLDETAALINALRAV